MAVLLKFYGDTISVYGVFIIDLFCDRVQLVWHIYIYSTISTHKHQAQVKFSTRICLYSKWSAIRRIWIDLPIWHYTNNNETNVRSIWANSVRFITQMDDKFYRQISIENFQIFYLICQHIKMENLWFTHPKIEILNEIKLHSQFVTRLMSLYFVIHT